MPRRWRRLVRLAYHTSFWLASLRDSMREGATPSLHDLPESETPATEGAQIIEERRQNDCFQLEVKSGAIRLNLPSFFVGSQASPNL